MKYVVAAQCILVVAMAWILFEVGIKYMAMRSRELQYRKPALEKFQKKTEQVSSIALTIVVVSFLLALLTYR